MTRATDRTPTDDILAFLTSSHMPDYGGSGKTPALLRMPGCETAQALAEKCYSGNATDALLSAYRAELKRAPLSEVTKARLQAETARVENFLKARADLIAADRARKTKDSERIAAEKRASFHVAIDADLAWLSTWLPSRKNHNSVLDTPDRAIARHVERYISEGVGALTYLKRRLLGAGAEWQSYLCQWRAPEGAKDRDVVMVRACDTIMRRLFKLGPGDLAVATAVLTRKLTNDRIAKLLAARGHSNSALEEAWGEILGVTPGEQAAADAALAGKSDDDEIAEIVRKAGNHAEYERRLAGIESKGDLVKLAEDVYKHADDDDLAEDVAARLEDV